MPNLLLVFTSLSFCFISIYLLLLIFYVCCIYSTMFVHHLILSFYFCSRLLLNHRYVPLLNIYFFSLHKYASVPLSHSSICDTARQKYFLSPLLPICLWLMVIPSDRPTTGKTKKVAEFFFEKCVDKMARTKCGKKQSCGRILNDTLGSLVLILIVNLLSQVLLH